MNHNLIRIFCMEDIKFILLYNQIIFFFVMIFLDYSWLTKKYKTVKGLK
jgi:hypothetical protein